MFHDYQVIADSFILQEYIVSQEPEEHFNAVQQCSVENQKGAITIAIVWW